MIKKFLLALILFIDSTAFCAAAPESNVTKYLIDQGQKDYKLLGQLDLILQEMKKEKDKDKLIDHTQKLYNKLNSYKEQNPHTLLHGGIFVCENSFREELEMRQKSEQFKDDKILRSHNLVFCKVVCDEISEKKTDLKQKYKKLVGASRPRKQLGYKPALQKDFEKK